MTELRRRMIEDMLLAGLADSTQKKYVESIRRLAKTFDRSPDRIAESEIRRYFLDLRDKEEMSLGAFNQHFYALRFLFENTLELGWGLFTKKKGRQAATEAAADRVERRGLPAAAGHGSRGAVPSVLLADVCVRASDR